MADRDAFLQVLREGSGLMGILLGKESLHRMASYRKELSRWNKLVNLVSRGEREEAWAERHFLDSLVPLSLGLLSGRERTVDLGAGAGFPGLPLAVALPGLRLSLVEAAGKKCAFLRHMARTLGLTGVEVRQERIEGFLAAGGAGRFDLALSRAAARPEQARDLALPFLRPGGRVLVWATDVPRGTSGTVHPYSLPFSRRKGVLWEVRNKGTEVGVGNAP